MEPKYIFAIVSLSLFFLLFVVFFIMLARRRRAEARLQAWLYEFYEDKNLVKETYESEDEVPDSPVRTADLGENEFGQENENNETVSRPEENYEQLEIEGIEEITGNYKPQ